MTTTRRKDKPRTFKVWVQMGKTRPRPLCRNFLNANPRILTVFTGGARPSFGAYSPPFVRATLTIESPKEKKRAGGK